MLITRLRLAGFKSFVEPTDLLIEPGLTGVVGPNGCGKSNLLEALRWVMGETSYKSMRASAMEDVIFAGAAQRPARDWAEVALVIDNARRTAPAEFNHVDIIEVARRIVRDAGSTYKINGREARARDVKVLFEDAASGARSPALVRQGQVGEIVNAKPENRRRILEDAAGIAGLHTRRHDAELRLQAAETNLARVADTTGQLASQIELLQRQARVARRYQELSAVIRRREALVLCLAWAHAAAIVDREEEALRGAQAALVEAAGQQARATAAEVAASERLGPLRDASVAAAAALARLEHERDALTAERQRTDREIDGLEDDLARARDDVAQLAQSERDMRVGITQRNAEIEECDRRIARAAGELASLESTVLEAVSRAREAETKLAALRHAAADHRAAVCTATDKRDDARRRVASSGARMQGLEAELQRLTADQGDYRIDDLLLTVARAEADLQTLSRDLTARKSALAAKQEVTEEYRAAARTAATRVMALETEQATLIGLTASTGRSGRAKLFSRREAPGQTDDTDRIEATLIEALTVAPGYERAVAAIFAQELEAPIGPRDGATRYWRLSEGATAAGPGPDELRALSCAEAPLSRLDDWVSGPDALARKLARCLVVGTLEQPEAHPAPVQLAALADGMVIVNPAGQLWRWDGYVVLSADAEARAAQVLSVRNRLKALGPLLAGARSEASQAGDVAADAERDLQFEAHAVRELEGRVTTGAIAHRRHLATLAEAERAIAVREARRESLDSQRTEAAALLAGERQELDAAERRLAELLAMPDRNGDLAAAETGAGDARSALAAVRAETARLAQLQHSEQRTRATLEAEQKRAEAQCGHARERHAHLRERLVALEARKSDLARQPAALDEAIAKVRAAIEQAASRRADASDALAACESANRVAAARLRECQAAVALAQDRVARAETRVEVARHARSAAARLVEDEIGAQVEDAARTAGLDLAAPLPDQSAIEAELAKLRSDRDRLGGVNLKASDDLVELERQFAEREAERVDVEQAVAKLRAGIGKLNRDARQRLAAAFERVNAEFSQLFITLFGGGEARLALVDAEDPLESGLEIIARPPGKKPTTLSLLSGGEQTLTALALIFAVFLTNPSPICVLDEVDAPLDDSNVDRFCTLLEAMTQRTQTRFLIITHHPMTMARMDRLYGVTMAERGVSQLVSVELAIAEQYLEAG
ncbi:MAG: chromosome segregation protein SMC [Hyphomicrobiaceae bacterium]